MESKDDCFYNSVYVVSLRLVFVSIVAENGREVAQKKGETFDTERQMALSLRKMHCFSANKANISFSLMKSLKIKIEKCFQT